MPKQNPKHKKTHLNRKSNLYKKKTSTSSFLSNTIVKSERIPSIPKIPSPNKLKRIQRQCEPILFNLESSIVTITSRNRNLKDINVLRVLAEVLWKYRKWSNSKAANRRRSAEAIPFNKGEQALLGGIYESIGVFLSDNWNDYTHRDIWNSVACLFDSARFWNRERGVTGYLDYISEFVPSASKFSEMLNMDLDDDWDDDDWSHHRKFA